MRQMQGLEQKYTCIYIVQEEERMGGTWERNIRGSFTKNLLEIFTSTQVIWKLPLNFIHLYFRSLRKLPTILLLYFYHWLPTAIIFCC